jgi:hypothetical protein
MHAMSKADCAGMLFTGRCLPFIIVAAIGCELADPLRSHGCHVWFALCRAFTAMLILYGWF